MSVEARSGALAVIGPGNPLVIPYPSVSWSRVVEPLAHDTSVLDVHEGQKVIMVSLAVDLMEDRWRLIINPDDLPRWQTLLARHGVRDAGSEASVTPVPEI